MAESVLPNPLSHPDRGTVIGLLPMARFAMIPSRSSRQDPFSSSACR